jgi:hypothetical protein
MKGLENFFVLDDFFGVADGSQGSDGGCSLGLFGLGLCVT